MAIEITRRGEINVPAFTLQTGEFENVLGRDKVIEALQILQASYPGYSWKVDVKGGGIFVRLLDKSLRGTWGIFVKIAATDHDAAVFKRKVKFAAGEFLERCNLIRGMARREDQIKRMDGVPEKWQPIDWNTVLKKPPLALY